MMTRKYYSQRKRVLNSHLNSDFWLAWLNTMQDFGSKNYLCEHFSNECCDGHPVGFNSETIQGKLYCELGDLKFSSFMTTDLSQDNMFDLIEFFFKYISKPTSGWNHGYCGSFHPESYDTPKGRYEYTIAVNDLFKRFNHPYKLKNGEIKLLGSPTLDTPLTTMELDTDDSHLKKLMEQALTDFYDRSGARKNQALQALVDVFERLKTIDHTNKKKSIAKIIGKLSPIECVQKNLNRDLRELTNVANNFCIRHHETTQKIIKDPDMVEFLFYLYFNYVRLIFKKYNLLKTNINELEDVSP